MESKITIFESDIEDGVMSRNKKFYKEDITLDEINKVFLNIRINNRNN